ncbi:hypothetical protein MTO96_033121 [Rhipicephalus appendiculatus]
MGAARKVALWQEVTAALNALGPAVKTVKLWRKYWSRLCYDSRKLARELERERRRTWGGRLRGVEGRVLAILDRTAPDSAPGRLFTSENEDNNTPRPEEAAAAVAVPIRPAPMPQPVPALRPAPPLLPATTPQPAPTAHVSVGSQQGTSGTAREAL